ncbi:NACHT domain-containing protein [Streptomyces tsukubensis]
MTPGRPGHEDLVVMVAGEVQGTGVRISPHLVLTCARVVGARQSARVINPATSVGRGEHPVIWSDSRLDAAVLLAGNGRLGFQPRLGALATDRPVPGRIIGHPVGRGSDRGGFKARWFTGTVPPVTDPGTLLFDFDTPPEGDPTDPHSPTSLIGAPLFAGDTLLGLVQRLSGNGGRIRAHCLPTRRLAEHPGLCALAPWIPSSLETVVHGTPDDIRYEEEYAQALAAVHRDTRIFGLDTPPSWDLEAAYLHLETDLGDPAASHGAPPRRVDSVIAGHPRILLRGEAGSGKTTLLSWLAARAVTRTLPDELGELNGLVPFLVPLRMVRLGGNGLPDPERLPQTASARIPDPPEGWALRVLGEGRALLLVDGVDEVPEEDRAATRTWLEQLLRAFPENRCIVAVRPGAVAGDWLTADDFTEVQLLPMSDREIEQFVESWFAAARTTEADLPPLEGTLRKRLAHDHVLRRLARTPLLCAVVCALHLQQRGDLPDHPWAIYEHALTVLLDRRDIERGVNFPGPPDGISLGGWERRLLLQGLAVRLARNGATGIPRTLALARIDQVRPLMPNLRDDESADRLLDHLVDRTGLLAERSGGDVCFVRPTFQDFFAAKEFVEGDHLDELLSRSGDERWADVILFAAGYCRSDQIDRFVHTLLANGRRAPDRYTTVRLAVLALRCIQYPIKVSPETREAVADAVGGFLPPLSTETADILGRLGTSVLPLLPEPELLPAAALAPTTSLVRRMDGPAARVYAERLALRLARERPPGGSSAAGA